MTVKPPANIAEASVYAQIRDRLFAMKNRMSVLEQRAGDLVVASAILTAPILSGLSDSELAMVKHKVEAHVDPAILAGGGARDGAAKALQEAEQGWAKAQDAVAQRAGLVKNADGSWGEPAAADAAA